MQPRNVPYSTLDLLGKIIHPPGNPAPAVHDTKEAASHPSREMPSELAMAADPPAAATTGGASSAGDERHLEERARGEVELQLKTVAGYARDRELRPLQWACCHCRRRQRYRDALGTLDSLRCADPTCGVSEKGFRICRVHESESPKKKGERGREGGRFPGLCRSALLTEDLQTVCDACTLFVDGRAPVTTAGLRRKREEARGALKRLKRVYDDVDRLVGFDAEEAVRVARELGERGEREELERERRAEEEERRAEAERLQNVAEAMAMLGGRDGGAGPGCGEERFEDDEEQGEAVEEGAEARAGSVLWRRQMESAGRPKKKGGLKALFGLSSGKRYIA